MGGGVMPKDSYNQVHFLANDSICCRLWTKPALCALVVVVWVCLRSMVLGCIEFTGNMNGPWVVLCLPVLDAVDIIPVKPVMWSEVHKPLLPS